jgi:hypothetical protein
MGPIPFLTQLGAAVFGWSSLAAIQIADVKDALQILVLILSAAVSVTALLTWHRNNRSK